MFQSKIHLRYRLLTKLLVSHILLASIPIIITGLVLVHTARQSIERMVVNRNSEFAKQAAQTISASLKQAQQVLEFNAENMLSSHTSRLAREILIYNIVEDFDIFKEIYILNKFGEIELSTHYIDNTTKFIGKNFVQKINMEESYFSDIYISDEKLPYMEFAEPISEYGEIVEILFAIVNLKAMWDIMDSSTVSQNVQALVFDKNGTYIAHSERKKVYLKESFPDTLIIEEISKEIIGHKIYKDQDGSKMIAAYAPLPMTKWGVVIQQPIKQAFAQARTMMIQIFIFVITSILIASLIAYIYTKKIVRPVNQLISGIERISTGDLKHRIPALGQDEISTLAEQFNMMASRLSGFQTKVKRTERFETLSKMASILSHEIKNPLNAMIINMQLHKKELLKKTLNKKKLEYYFDIVHSEITRVDKLVNNFLLFARPPMLEKKVISIQNILNQIILEQQNNTLQRNVKVDTKFHTNPITISADENRIKQALLNFYLNSVEAMPDGGKLTINVTVEEDDKEYYRQKSAKISFKDSGIGISKSQQKHIFDFYYTTKEGGTGLGLAIAQQIIEEHDGTIELESQKGKGTTFIISLPFDYNQ